MGRRTRPIAGGTPETRRAIALCASLFCLWACGGGIDRRDELGLEGDGGRREVVEVGRSQRAPAPPDSPRSTSPRRPGPEAVPEEGAGGAVVYDPHGQFTVQIGGYRDERKARALVRQLGEAGYPAYAIARRGSGEMRVRIGYFASREDAERFGAIFEADFGMEYWVDKRENE